MEGSIEWLRDVPERILIYSDAKIGKTWSACSFIEAFEKSKFYYFNTDGGFVKTFKNYFGERAKEVAKRVEYIRVKNIKEVVKKIKEVKEKVNPNDWIIFDLISDFWDFSQDEFITQTAKAYGGNVVDLILNASRDKAKFGLFNSIQWQYIKKLDNIITFDLLSKNPPANILGLGATKDVEVEETLTKIHGGKVDRIISEYENIGKRPAGQKQLSYKFDTVIYLPEKGKAKIVGTREKVKKYEFEFGKSFYKAWKDVKEE